MGIDHERWEQRSWLPSWVRYEHQARYRFAAAFLQGKTVVDCACGGGLGSQVFAQAGARAVVGFDRCAAAVAAAQRRCASLLVQFGVADARRLPLPNHMVDVYIALETIEHLSPDTAFVAEVVRVLKPDGLLICSTPNRSITNPGTTITHRPWNRFHLREYTPRELLGLLTTAFREVQLYGQNRQSHAGVRLMERLAPLIPRRGAAILHQLMKLPSFLTDAAGRHVVQPLDNGQEYEYLVAVCRQPRPAAAMVQGGTGRGG